MKDIETWETEIFNMFITENVLSSCFSYRKNVLFLARYPRSLVHTCLSPGTYFRGSFSWIWSREYGWFLDHDVMIFDSDLNRCRTLISRDQTSHECHHWQVHQNGEWHNSWWLPHARFSSRYAHTSDRKAITTQASVRNLEARVQCVLVLKFAILFRKI